MLMSEREWRVLSLLQRLDRREVTVGEVAACLGRSRRQVQRMRKRFAGKGKAGLVHGNAGRCPKHRTSQEVREQVLMLRRGKYDGSTTSTSRRSWRRSRVWRREWKAQAEQMILWDGSEHDWLEGRGPRLCLMGAIDDATGEFLPGAHFTEQKSTLGYLRVLRDILREKGIPHTVYGHRHSSVRRNDKHWTLEEELAGAARANAGGTSTRDEPTRRTRPTLEKMSSSNTCSQATTAYSTARNASHGWRRTAQAFNQQQKQQREGRMTGVTFSRSS